MISSISTTSSVGATSSADPSEFIKKMFSKTDTDGDGKVLQEEFTAAMEKRLGTSGDDENAPDAAEIFKSVDTDGDGAITSSEFETAFKSMRAQGQQQPPPPPPSAGGSDEAVIDSAQVFDVLDTDEDGTVSFEELQAALTKKAEASGETSDTAGTDDFKKLFDSIDTDGDGAISGDEFKTMLEKMQQNRTPPPPDSAVTYAPNGEPTSSTSSDSVGTILKTVV